MINELISKYQKMANDGYQSSFIAIRSYHRYLSDGLDWKRKKTQERFLWYCNIIGYLWVRHLAMITN